MSNDQSDDYNRGYSDALGDREVVNLYCPCGRTHTTAYAPQTGHRLTTEATCAACGEPMQTVAQSGEWRRSGLGPSL